MAKKFLAFRVVVPAHGTDGERLKVGVVADYIRDAVRSWSGQFNPAEDNMFYWCAGNDGTSVGDTKVTQIRRRCR